MQPFITLLYRECFRFIRLFRQTIVPPTISTLLFILIFGYSLGSSIRQVAGFDYIIFILPGLAQMGIINNAYQNTSTSLFMMRMERSIENLLVAPLSHTQIVTAFLLGGVLRGLTVGFASLLIAVFFVDFPVVSLGWLFLSWFLTSTFFAGLGIIISLISDSWDHIGILGNFVLLPLTYLGGTFYSIDMLPTFWRQVSYFNPIFYAVDSTRYAILGVSEFSWGTSFLFLFILTATVVGTCIVMFRRGVKLIS